MKLKALRVAQVGRFDEPVAVEGFSGGLDVLAGPNEMGKSTLFRALRLLLTTKHSARGGSVTGLIPYAGGQPTVEADLEIGGTLWRMTKRYGKGPRAQLTDLGRNVVISRGTEADEKITELIGSGDGHLGTLGLVWVGQKQALVTPRPDFDPGKTQAKDRGERSALMRVIEAEVGAMTGGAVADRISARVEAELGELVTSRGARKGSRYAVLLDRRDDLARELAEGRAALDIVAARQAELDELQTRMADAERPDALNAMEKRLSALAEQREQAEKQVQSVRQARDAVSIQEKEQEAARGVLTRFDGDLLKLQQLTQAIEEDEARLPQMRSAAIAAQEAYDACRADGEQLGGRERELRLLKDRQAVSTKYAEQSAKLADAEKLDADIAEIAEQMKSDPVTEDRVDRLLHIENQRHVLEGRLSAESPVIRVSYEAGVSPCIGVDGEVLADGRELTATEPVVLNIPGVGSIEIAPGSGEGREVLSEQLLRLTNERADLLGKLSVVDLDEARALLSERKSRDRNLSESIAQLRGLAPDGVQSLRSDVADLENRLGAASGDDGHAELPASLDEIEAELGEVSAALAAARAVYRERHDAREKSSKLLAEAEAELRSRVLQRDELAAALGDEAGLEQAREDIAKRVEIADQKVNEALRTLSALEETAPDDAALADLRERYDVAREDLRRANLDAQTSRERMVELSTQIDMAGANGVGRRVAECEGELARVQEDVARIAAHVAALRLLQEALQQARSNAQHKLIAPLQDRLSPYIASVLGDAQVQFQEGFAPGGLYRGGHDVEDIDALSDGTQEQLAILVRLAYARLLADGGNSLPLVLDDPLAYSDSARIAQMFGALQSASEHHQVVVLTCRETSFKPLGGTWLEPEPWRGVTDLG